MAHSIKKQKKFSKNRAFISQLAPLEISFGTALKPSRSVQNSYKNNDTSQIKPTKRGHNRLFTMTNGMWLAVVRATGQPSAGALRKTGSRVRTEKSN